jgi:UDP-glucose 4-epimerase
MNKIAVTGANGMAGSHLVCMLESQKIPVKAITRKEWDLTEWKSFAELDEIFDSVQAIFHFGAKLPYKKLESDNQQTQQIFDTNVRSCLNIAEWATISKIPIIFLSGALVYKDSHALKIKEEDAKVTNGFGGLYGYSKLISENILDHFSLEGLKCVILRPSSIYGYGLPSEKLVQNYIDIALAGETIQITAPNNKINLIHAYDVATAALKAYKSQSWGVFNISSDLSNSIAEIAEIATSISKNGNTSIMRSGDDNSFERFDLDSSLAKKTFGFSAVVSLKEGMLLMKERRLI